MTTYYDDIKILCHFRQVRTVPKEKVNLLKEISAETRAFSAC